MRNLTIVEMVKNLEEINRNDYLLAFDNYIMDNNEYLEAFNPQTNDSNQFMGFDDLIVDTIKIGDFIEQLKGLIEEGYGDYYIMDEDTFADRVEINDIEKVINIAESEY